MEAIANWLILIFWQVFSFLFFTIWGWLILLFVVVPAIRHRLRTFGRRRTFYRARRAELANPKNASVRFLLGRIHFDGRQYRRALTFFQEAVRIASEHGTPVDPKLYQFLGHTLRRLGHPREAIAAYEAGLDEAPESGRGESETGLGCCFRKLGSDPEAEEWFRRAMEVNQSLLQPRVRLAALLQRKGEGSEAESVLREARELQVPDYLHRQQRRWRLALWIFPLSAPLL
jgi:tetratricopeptide (TPR) repeat protein